MIFLAGMNEMFSQPIGASQAFSCDRVRYILLAGMNEMFFQPIWREPNSQSYPREESF